jgi:putative glycosyltransferase (TIGR04372 family)
MRELANATISIGGRRIMVARPFAAQYGHLGLEMLMSLALAKRRGASVYFVRPRRVVGEGLFELESPDVPVLHPYPPIGTALRAWLSVAEVGLHFKEWKYEFGVEVRRELVYDIERHISRPGLPGSARRELRGVREGLRATVLSLITEGQSAHGYFRRRLLHERLPVRLRPAAHAHAARAAEAHGIDPAAPLVCVHNREAGYKRGREIHELKPDTGRDDSVRNGRIESYFPAVDELVRRGYTVVRLGDPSMTPVARRGMVDVARSPMRSNLLEIYCLLRSDFILAGESGLAGVSYLTNTPIVLVNVTEPIAIYPIRAPGLFVPKTIIDRRTGKPVPLLGQIAQDYQDRMRDQRRYLYIDTPPEAIAEAALEMLDWVKGRWTESEAQREYHTAITTAAPALRLSNAYVRKWGPDEGFLGDGRIARAAFR